MTPDELAKSGTEHAQQRALFAWASKVALCGFVAARDPLAYTSPAFVEMYASESVWVLKTLFAIPNGGERHKAVAGRLKAEGVKRGVPDTMLPVPCWGKAGLFIEMKKPGVSAVAKDKQAVWQRDLIHLGYASIVCVGWEQAATAIEAYLKGTLQCSQH